MGQDGAHPRVEIYTRFGCGYCTRARQLLLAKGVDFVEHDTTLCAERRREMLERKPDATTVPQIFIHGQPIGGADDLAALEQAGELDRLLGAGR